MMRKTIGLTALTTLLTATTLSLPALAAGNIEYPVSRPNLPIHRSYLSGSAVTICPYRHVFPIRIFTTPQQQPFYNVPPYAVISPY